MSHPLTQPPNWFPSAVASTQGWENPTTGEILVAIPNLAVRNHGAYAANQYQAYAQWSKPHYYESCDMLFLDLTFAKAVRCNGTPMFTVMIGTEELLVGADEFTGQPLRQIRFGGATTGGDGPSHGTWSFKKGPRSAYYVVFLAEAESDGFIPYVDFTAVTPGSAANRNLGVRIYARRSGANASNSSLPADANSTLNLTLTNGIVDIQLATDNTGTPTTTWQDILGPTFEAVASSIMTLASNGLRDDGANLVKETAFFMDGKYVNNPMFLDNGADDGILWSLTVGYLLDPDTLAAVVPAAIVGDMPTLIPLPPTSITFNKHSYTAGETITATMKLPLAVSVSMSGLGGPSIPEIDITNGTDNVALHYVSGNGTDTWVFAGPAMSSGGTVRFGHAGSSQPTDGTAYILYFSPQIAPMLANITCPFYPTL